MTEHHGLGDLQVQAGGIHAGGGQHIVNAIDEIVGMELLGTDVDRQLGHVDPVLLPGDILGTGLMQHPIADVDDEIRLLCDGDELRRRDQGPPRRLPADQRLHPDDVTPFDHVLGLIVEGQLLIVEGTAQLVVNEQAPISLQLHGGIEETPRLAARRLGLIHGGVGLLEQVPGFLLPAREQGDTDAGSDVQHLAAMTVRGSNLPDEPLRDEVGLHLRLGRADGEAGQQQHELVTTESGQTIPLSHQPLEAARHLLEQPVAGGMTEGVVDGLEVIEVDEQQSADQVLAARLAECLGQGLVELAAIGQTGQLVVIGEILDAALRRLTLGDVFEEDDVVADAPLVILHRRDDFPLGIDMTVGVQSQGLTLPAIQGVELIAEPPEPGPEVVAKVQAYHPLAVEAGDLAEGVIDPQDLEVGIRDDDAFMGFERHRR